MAKIGTGHLEAFLRQGTKEVAQILPAFPESVRVVEEPGLMGNVIPQEVGEQKGLSGYEESLLKYASRANEPGNERGMER